MLQLNASSGLGYYYEGITSSATEKNMSAH